MTEKEIQTEILNYLHENDYFAWKNHTGGIHRRGQRTTTNPNKGAPDIFAIKDGTFYGIEVKRPGGVVASHQYDWLGKLREHGGVAIIADSLVACLIGIKEGAIRWEGS